MEPTTCDGGYSKSGQIFRCTKSPHAHRPHDHNFVRDLVAEARARPLVQHRRRTPLVRRPGPLEPYPRLTPEAVEEIWG